MKSKEKLSLLTPLNHYNMIPIETLIDKYKKEMADKAILINKNEERVYVLGSPEFKAAQRISVLMDIISDLKSLLPVEQQMMDGRIKGFIEWANNEGWFWDNREQKFIDGGSLDMAVTIDECIAIYNRHLLQLFTNKNEGK